MCVRDVTTTVVTVSPRRPLRDVGHVTRFESAVDHASLHPDRPSGPDRGSPQP